MDHLTSFVVEMFEKVEAIVDLSKIKMVLVSSLH